MDWDAIIVGTGQAGPPLATKLAKAGKRVLIAERAEVGGTCINSGCTPTKTLIATARAAHAARSGARLGVQVSGVQVDLKAAVERKDRIVSDWRQGVRGGLESTPGITLAQGHARFVGDRELEIEGQRHRSPTVVLNVGARPSVPKLPGLDAVPFLDNRRLMELKQAPAHLLVLGGGYIGCELGQAYRRFGCKVTVIDGNPRLLSREDPDISQALGEVFRKEGIDLKLGVKVSRVESAPAGVRVVLDQGAVEGTNLLVATGRMPNTDDLGCERAGIQRDERGFLTVDEQYRTSAAGVFALGDCTPQPQFTHTSWDDHRVVYDVLMGRPARKRSERHIPYAVFTDPQVAGVGLNEAEARKRGVPFELATMPFGDVARAAETDEPAGLLKLLIDPQSEQILGVSLMGAEVGELVHVFVALLQAKATARAILDAEFVHPTYAEGLQSLVLRLPRYAQA